MQKRLAVSDIEGKKKHFLHPISEYILENPELLSTMESLIPWYRKEKDLSGFEKNPSNFNFLALSEDIMVLIPLNLDEKPLGLKLLRQISSEVFCLKDVSKTLPFISLHMKEDGSFYSVFPLSLHNTLIGETLCYLSYYLSGMLHGGIYLKESVEPVNSDFFSKHSKHSKAIDLKAIIKQELNITYHSLAEAIAKSGISLSQQDYTSTFSIIYKIEFTYAYQNVLIPYPSFDIQVSVKPSKAYQKILDFEFEKFGQFPKQWAEVQKVYSDFALLIKSIFPKLSFSKKYLQYLKTITSFYYVSLYIEKIGMQIQIRKNSNHTFSSPLIFPRLPLRYIQKPQSPLTLFDICLDLPTEEKQKISDFISLKIESYAEIEESLIKEILKKVKEKHLTIPSSDLIFRESLYNLLKRISRDYVLFELGIKKDIQKVELEGKTMLNFLEDQYNFRCDEFRDTIKDEIVNEIDKIAEETLGHSNYYDSISSFRSEVPYIIGQKIIEHIQDHHSETVNQGIKDSFQRLQERIFQKLDELELKITDLFERKHQEVILDYEDEKLSTLNEIAKRKAMLEEKLVPTSQYFLDRYEISYIYQKSFFETKEPRGIQAKESYSKRPSSSVTCQFEFNLTPVFSFQNFQDFVHSLSHYFKEIPLEHLSKLSFEGHEMMGIKFELKDAFYQQIATPRFGWTEFWDQQGFLDFFLKSLVPSNSKGLIKSTFPLFLSSFWDYCKIKKLLPDTQFFFEEQTDIQPRLSQKKFTQYLINIAIQKSYQDIALALIPTLDQNDLKSNLILKSFLLTAELGLSEIAFAFLNAGINHTVLSSDGLSFLHIAAQKGHLDCLKLWFNSKLETVDIDSLDTPLHFAVEGGHPECVVYLLDYFDIETKNKFGKSSLDRAFEHGFESIADILLRHVDFPFTTLTLYRSVKYGFLSIANWFIFNGAKWYEKAPQSRLSLLEYAALKGTLLNLSIETKASSPEEKADQNKILNQAVLGIQPNTLSAILETSDFSHFVSSQGLRLIHIYAKLGMKKELIACLKNGENPCICVESGFSESGKTPLDFAFENIEYNLVAILLDYYSPNEINSKSMAIFFAKLIVGMRLDFSKEIEKKYSVQNIFQNHTDSLVAVLIQYDALAPIKNLFLYLEKKYPSLDENFILAAMAYAIKHKKPFILIELLTLYASKNKKIPFSVLRQYIEDANTETLYILVQHFPKILQEIDPLSQETVLFTVIRSKNLDLLTAFLTLKPSLDIKNKEGLTPFDLAISLGFLEALPYLKTIKSENAVIIAYKYRQWSALAWLHLHQYDVIPPDILKTHQETFSSEKKSVNREFIRNLCTSFFQDSQYITDEKHPLLKAIFNLDMDYLKSWLEKPNYYVCYHLSSHLHVMTLPKLLVYLGKTNLIKPIFDFMQGNHFHLENTFLEIDELSIALIENLISQGHLWKKEWKNTEINLLVEGVITKDNLAIFQYVVTTLLTKFSPEKINGYIYLAAEKNAIQILQFLIKTFPHNLNAYNPEGLTPLMIAARKGHIEVIRTLIEKGADINNTSLYQHLTALYEAIYSKCFQSSIFLLQEGANPFLKDCYGRNALHLTATNGNAILMRHLIQQMNKNVNTPDYFGNTALHYAAYAKKPDMVSALIQAGADPTRYNKEAPTIYHDSVFKTVENPVQLSNATPLLIAIEGGDPLTYSAFFNFNQKKILTYFILDSIPTKNMKGIILEDAISALKRLPKRKFADFMLEAARNSSDVFLKAYRALNSIKLDMLKKSSSQFIFKAIEGNQPDVVALLKDLSMGLHPKDFYDALVFAIQKDRPNILKQLLLLYPDFNFQSEERKPDPVDIAINEGKETMAIILMIDPRTRFNPTLDQVALFDKSLSRQMFFLTKLFLILGLRPSTSTIPEIEMWVNRRTEHPEEPVLWTALHCQFTNVVYFLAKTQSVLFKSCFEELHTFQDSQGRAFSYFCIQENKFKLLQQFNLPIDNFFIRNDDGNHALDLLRMNSPMIFKKRLASLLFQDIGFSDLPEKEASEKFYQKVLETKHLKLILFCYELATTYPDPLFLEFFRNFLKKSSRLNKNILLSYLESFIEISLHYPSSPESKKIVEIVIENVLKFSVNFLDKIQNLICKFSENVQIEVFEKILLWSSFQKYPLFYYFLNTHPHRFIFFERVLKNLEQKIPENSKDVFDILLNLLKKENLSLPEKEKIIEFCVHAFSQRPYETFLFIFNFDKKDQDKVFHLFFNFIQTLLDKKRFLDEFQTFFVHNRWFKLINCLIDYQQEKIIEQLIFNFPCSLSFYTPTPDYILQFNKQFPSLLLCFYNVIQKDPTLLIEFLKLALIQQDIKMMEKIVEGGNSILNHVDPSAFQDILLGNHFMMEISSSKIPFLIKGLETSSLFLKSGFLHYESQIKENIINVSTGYSHVDKIILSHQKVRHILGCIENAPTLTGAQKKEAGLYLIHSYYELKINKKKRPALAKSRKLFSSKKSGKKICPSEQFLNELKLKSCFQ